MIAMTPRKELIWDWLPVLTPEDRPAVQRLLNWKLVQTKRIYRLNGIARWVEYPAESDGPPILGYEADAEEIR
jgi:hypothetical protein